MELASPAYRPLWVLLVLFLVVNVLWAISVPPFESPDEIHHLAYVQFVAQEGRLPVQMQEGFPLLDHESHQPPFYYLMGSVIYRLSVNLGSKPVDLRLWAGQANPNFIGRNQGVGKDQNFFVQNGTFFAPGPTFPYDLIVVRFYSSVLAAVSLVAVYATCLAIWQQAKMALVGTGLLAFIPQFSFITASTNNDSMAIAVGAFCVWLMTVILIRENVSIAHYFWLGSLLGLGILAKLTLLSLMPVSFLLLIAQTKNIPRRLFQAAVLFICGFLLVSGWWFIRNQLLYGDLLGDHWKVNPSAFAWDLAPKSLFSDYFRPDIFWKRTAKSFVGQFGFMHIEMPSFAYLLYLGTLLAGIAGSAMAVLRPKGLIPVRVLMAMMLFVVFAIVQLVYLNLKVSQPQGRYLFHVAGAIIVIVVTGLWSFAPSRCPHHPGRDTTIAPLRLHFPKVGYLYITLLAATNLYVLQRLLAVYELPSFSFFSTLSTSWR